MVAVPVGAEELVAKSEDQDVLDHLLSKVVVDTENLLLLPVGLQGVLKLSGAAKVLAEGLLNLCTVVSSGLRLVKALGTDNDTGNAVLGVTVLLEHLRDVDEDTGGQSHVEDTVSLFLVVLLLEFAEVLLEALVVFVFVVFFALEVCAETAEFLQLVLNILVGGLDVRLDTLDELGVVHLGSCITNNLDVLGKEVVLVLYVAISQGSTGARARCKLTRPKRAGNCRFG